MIAEKKFSPIEWGKEGTHGRKKKPHYKHWIMHILQKENSVAPKKDDKRLIMRDKWIITAAVVGGVYYHCSKRTLGHIVSKIEDFSRLQK